MNYQEQIDRFLSHKMSAEEQLAFEQQLQKNPDLLKEVEEAKLAIQKLKELERLALKTRLQDIETQIEKREKTKPLIWITLFITVLGIGLWLWYNQQKYTAVPNKTLEAKEEPDSNATLQNKEIIPVDSPIIAPPLENEMIKEQTPSKAVREEIFAAHFEPYTDDDIEYEVRSNQEKSAFELYKHYYINYKYDKALLAYENLDASEKSKEQVLFMKANIYMATNKINEALTILSTLQKNPQSAYTKDIQWYLALCYIRRGEISTAKRILNRMEQPYLSKAKKISGQL